MANQKVTMNVVSVTKNQKGVKVVLFVPDGFPAPALAIQTVDVEFSEATKSLSVEEEE